MKALEKAPEWKSLANKALAWQLDQANQKYLKKLNNVYPYWDTLKYKTNAPIKVELLWAALKMNRLHGSRIKFGKHNFLYNLTDFIQKELHEFDLHLGGRLGSGNLIPENEKSRYLISSIMEEAIASSQIEGAVTTRKHAKEMLRKNVKPRNKSEQMIFNNFATIRHIVNIQKEPINKEQLFEIHRLITKETLDDESDVGKYRTDNTINVVDALDGEIAYTPPDHLEIEGIMNELFEFFNHNSEEDFIHPIIKACIIHFMIGYIHPFVDGNGRTARALFYWCLLKNGYWLTEYLSISRLIIKSKTAYAKAFLYSETDDNDLTYFIVYKLRTMRLAYISLTDYLSRKLEERKQLSNITKIPGVNSRQAQILKWVSEESDNIYYVREIQMRFNTSNQTARNDLEGLKKMGFLIETDIDGKTKGFYKAESFDSLLNKKLRSLK